MDTSTERTATDWIALWRFANPGDAPEQVRADADSMFDIPRDQPDLAWEAIRHVVSQHVEADLFCVEQTEAQRVIGALAAGPLEDLLGFHGPRFIDRVETEASRDRRMAWALGGVWQFTMSDDVWGRVQQAADTTSYWHRPVPR